jgi:transposase-like protein
VIGLAVRWYVRYRLSYADVAEWLAERGLTVDRSTVYRWVRRFLPLLREAARHYRRPVGGRWRVDETYCRLNGRWAYCYRAIDQDGQVVDVYLSERRNAAAAQAFFVRAIDETGVTPERVVTDKAACYPPALRAVLPAAEHRTSKYLNNGVERDHGHLKQRLRPMRGFKQLGVGGPPDPRPRPRPEPAEWVLHADGPGPAPAAPGDGMAAARPRDLSPTRRRSRRPTPVGRALAPAAQSSATEPLVGLRC